MKILGNRVLVKRIEQQKVEGGFSTVDVQDDFVYKGEVVALGDTLADHGLSTNGPITAVKVGDTIAFAKYSPDSHEIKHEDQVMKVVAYADILAVL